MTDRPSLFEDDDLGLDRFTPKSGVGDADVPPETIRQIAVAGGFPSRAGTMEQPSTKRQPMTYRTGRTATLSVKTTPAALETFYEIARKQGWKAGETFEHAIRTLQRTLE